MPGTVIYLRLKKQNKTQTKSLDVVYDIFVTILQLRE